MFAQQADQAYPEQVGPTKQKEKNDEGQYLPYNLSAKQNHRNGVPLSRRHWFVVIDRAIEPNIYKNKYAHENDLDHVPQPNLWIIDCCLRRPIMVMTIYLSVIQPLLQGFWKHHCSTHDWLAGTPFFFLTTPWINLYCIYSEQDIQLTA